MLTAVAFGLLLLQSPDLNSVVFVHSPSGVIGVAETKKVRKSISSRPLEGVPVGDTPEIVRRFYGISRDKGSKTIAVVIPFHYPNVSADLDRFSHQFTLRKCNKKNRCLRVIETTGISCTWAREAALSLQWAHAIAPRAHLLLVEAASAGPQDLFPAIARAAFEVIHAGGGEVVLPWTLCGSGICERPNDRQRYDQYFIDGVVYFAATGDEDGTPTYPSTSSKVVAVGGTIPDDKMGDAEVGWEHGGGGQSKYVPKPSFQMGVENMPNDARYTPDIGVSARTVAVYFTSPCPGQISSGWQAFQGGTSAAAPIAAGLANVSGRFNSSAQAELANIYGNRNNAARIRDITLGSSGDNAAEKGYDTVTGVGAPVGTDFDAPPRISKWPKKE